MKNLFLLLPILLLFINCENALKGEGEPDLAQDYKLEPFSTVKASGKFKLILIPNDSVYLSVQTHRNLIDNMDIYVQNNTLNIGEKEEIDSFESYVVYLYYDRELDEINLHKKVYMESSTQLTFDDLEINMLDESVIKQFGLNVKELDLKVKDKAEAIISGSAVTVDVDAEHYANVNLEELNTKVLKVDLSGESVVTANVNKELSGTVGENSTLTYLGSPQKDVEVKDNGEILND